ncbi:MULTISPECIES: tRNA (adenosine(37)-N6)-threonylcarbamoyltransferase complex transferase subunit TsaD [Vagococcus]|uniref:tRNA N6-adenosine threonylcarbamoyltransferase n=1 Tax=Vagococcus fluvialis bH819 TaxID=1255619 RepID=A0A1X6WR61_9ENTE|nr:MULTISPECIES: tRNA (adenosine(37)-N6)-threonylcarbamoyltransferase complex transferase subunit TsaD [Vagococcus]SLM86765.1 TsaD/Kae1/Qri7 protein, required for threonylcarbamoyladenosine t(6)A37 formation in tRNA [Vagococcus fluvialis bH819]HCM88775.1 tRNA (adenosine(37)-N6)-threonylcarbamoyltransferase complex transferase subunit TsaD [Vagococcus sp.]
MNIFKNKKRKLILAIESSCDETSVAIIEDGNQILSNIVASQINSHKRFGGVVPEVASRHHVEQIIGCIDESLKEANVEAADLGAVAVTYGPGLVGALLIGITAAKSFAWANELPLIPVNHMAGHIYAASFVSEMSFPAMALLVSGGHTELVYMKEHGSFEIIGETRDDACGEAYDKVGRVLGLKYPSGKEIDQMAHVGEDSYNFPRAMIREDNYDFSFSGLKSSFINLVHNAEQRDELLDNNNLAASFQASVIEVLVAKTMRACKEYNVKQLIVAGGVAANQGLRTALEKSVHEELNQVKFIVPPLRLCGDNAAMIGAAAFIEAEKGNFASWDLNAKPSVTL